MQGALCLAKAVPGEVSRFQPLAQTAAPWLVPHLSNPHIQLLAGPISSPKISLDVLTSPILSAPICRSCNQLSPPPPAVPTRCPGHHRHTPSPGQAMRTLKTANGHLVLGDFCSEQTRPRALAAWTLKPSAHSWSGSAWVSLSPPVAGLWTRWLPENSRLGAVEDPPHPSYLESPCGLTADGMSEPLLVARTLCHPSPAHSKESSVL